MTAPRLFANFWVAVLVVSVLLNGILIGVVAQRSFGPPGLPGHAGAAPTFAQGQFNPRAFLAAMPEDRRAEAEGRLRAGMSGMRPLMRQTYQARRAAQRVLETEPFDEAAAREALNAVRERRLEIEALGESVILDIVAELDPDTRQQVLTAAYAGRPPFGRERRHGGRGEPHGDRRGPPDR